VIILLNGRWLFPVGIVAFGIQNIFYTGYVQGLELTPEWAPWHTFWAYLDGVLLIAGGVGIAMRQRWGATIVGLVYFASVLLVRIPRIGLSVHDISERTVLLEPLVIGCAAFVLTGIKGPWRTLIGGSMVVFGIDHLEVPRFIATLIPAWIPARLFWAWFTGFAFIAAGLSIMTRWKLRLGAGLLGLMFFLWVLLVHAPQIAASPHNGNEWNSGFVALAMCGAAWILTE
jgi:uncharacterized membrane protein